MYSIDKWLKREEDIAGRASDKRRGRNITSLPFRTSGAREICNNLLGSSAAFHVFMEMNIFVRYTFQIVKSNSNLKRRAQSSNDWANKITDDSRPGLVETRPPPLGLRHQPRWMLVVLHFRFGSRLGRSIFFYYRNSSQHVQNDLPQ